MSAAVPAAASVIKPVSANTVRTRVCSSRPARVLIFFRFLIALTVLKQKLRKNAHGEFWSTGAVKGRLVEVLKEIVAEHQQKRDLVTDDVVREWMKERPLL